MENDKVMVDEIDWDDPTCPTPSVDEFLEMEKQDRHLWWKIGSGRHQSLFDSAVEERDRLRIVLAKIKKTARTHRDIAPNYNIPEEVYEDVCKILEECHGS